MIAPGAGVVKGGGGHRDIGQPTETILSASAVDLTEPAGLALNHPLPWSVFAALPCRQGLWRGRSAPCCGAMPHGRVHSDPLQFRFAACRPRFFEAEP